MEFQGIVYRYMLIVKLRMLGKMIERKRLKVPDQSTYTIDWHLHYKSVTRFEVMGKFR